MHVYYITEKRTEKGTKTEETYGTGDIYMSTPGSVSKLDESAATPLRRPTA
ncbi:8205_t:CDS:1, partial [Funneliformis caledonium]